MNIKALHELSYGLYLVCSGKGDKFNGQIANSVFQVCSDPPVVAVAINKNNLTHEFIVESGVFTVSILAQETPLSFIGNFGFKSGRDIDKFKGINYITGETRAAVVTDNAIAYLEAEIRQQIDVVTHTIFIGDLIGADVLKEDEPLTYAYYLQIKRGVTPKTAPSYIKEERETTTRMVKYECSVCGYIYDPAQGDAVGGIKPGTPFEEIPDDWVCPICGASKGEFKKIEG